MRKLLSAAILVTCFALSALAQSPGDHKKVEVFVGYSHNRVDAEADDLGLARDFSEREGFNGVNASITGNVSRYVGFKFDYSYHRGEIDGTVDVVCIQAPCLPVPFSADARAHNFLGGVQLKDNTKDADKRFRPFGHALVGAHNTSVEIPPFPCAPSPGFVCLPGPFFRTEETGFAAAVGGGLDVRLSDRVSVRAVQLDWNPNRFGSDRRLGARSHTSHNFRVGVGVVFN